MATALHSNGSLGFKWALADVTVTAFGNYALQSGEVELTGDEKTIKDASGTEVIWYGYNTKKEATFEYVVTGAAANISASITAPTFGTLFTVSSTNTGNPLTGSNYIVKNSSIKQANEDAAKVTVKATAYDAITS